MIECGGIPHIYLEDKYDDKLEIFANELPAGKCIMMLVNCNLERAKELFTGKICISGGVDGTLLQYGTKDQVIANVKNAIDILAPGGGYFLNTDMSLDVAKPENLHAMFENGAQLYEILKDKIRTGRIGIRVQSIRFPFYFYLFNDIIKEIWERNGYMTTQQIEMFLSLAEHLKFTKTAKEYLYDSAYCKPADQPAGGRIWISAVCAQ